jgi:hypothetical protein
MHALAAGRYDYVVVVPPDDDEIWSRITRWVGADAAATRLSGTGSAAVFRIDRPLSGRTCS